MSTNKNVSSFRLKLGALLLLCGTAQQLQAANSLEEVTFTTLPGNSLQIGLRLASPPAEEPLSFTIDNPARITLDLPDTRNNLKQRTLPIGQGLARSISTAEAKGKTRVVLNLTQLVQYRTQIQNDTIYLTLENELGSLSTLPETQEQSSRSKKAAAAPSPGRQRSITDIDFRRGGKGEGRVMVDMSDAKIPVDVKQEGDRLVVDFLGARLPDALARRLDVLDFATPAKTVDSFANGSNVRIIVTPIDGNYEHLAYQSDDMFTLELKPIPKEVKQQQIKEKFGYTGERLSLNFQDIEVRSVLQLIADFTNLNVVVSDSVTGRLTLRLKNVPWDQALDIILNSKGLAQRKSGNVLLIAPTEEIATREKLELEAMQQVQELAPLRSEYIQINYAKAQELAALLRGGETKGGSLLSDRGRVSIDQRTNTLLVQDTAEKLEEVRSLVARLDIPVRQVEIVSRIVIASNDFNKELGIRFGSSRNSTRANGEGTINTGNLNAVTDILNGDPIELNDRMNVNLPTTASSFGTLALALAKLPFGTLLELELSSLQAEGRGEVISTPRVLTANQKEAFIEQGVEIPYEQSTSSGATSIAFKKAVLSLLVTPQITPDDRIIMDLTVNNDTVGELFSGIPSIDTREVNTQVLVNNGETVVLGGIFEQITREDVAKVPFFGDLPGIGRLFRRTTTEDDKSELLIFVTPKIIKDSIALN